MGPSAIKPLPCPVCRSPASPEFKPFCSRRCADLDLSRWLTGGYAIPATAAPDDDEDGREDDREGPAD